MVGDRVCGYCTRHITQAGEMYALLRIDGLDKKMFPVLQDAKKQPDTLWDIELKPDENCKRSAQKGT